MGNSILNSYLHRSAFSPQNESVFIVLIEFLVEFPVVLVLFQFQDQRRIGDITRMFVYTNIERVYKKLILQAIRPVNV